MTHSPSLRPFPPTLPSRRGRVSLVIAASAIPVLALLVAGSLPAQAPAEAAKKPKLTVEEPMHETGPTARDQIVQHTFKIRNSGDARLEIRNLLLPPNVELVSKPKSLAPGEGGEIRVRVPLLNDKALALSKQFELQTNDPETPSLALELRIESVEYIVAKPGYARWIYVQHEKAGTISQRLATRDRSDFEVLDISKPPAGITVSKKSVQPDATGPREWQVDLTLSEDAPVGAIVGTLLIHVKHPKQSIVPIPLSGFVRPAVVVTPNDLQLGDLVLVSKQTTELVVKAYSTAPIRVVSVEHDLQGFPPAVVETIRPGREYKVRLEFDPATLPKGAFRGTLKIHTDSSSVPVVSVPIDGTLK